MTNGYIFRYTITLVIIVAIILSATATLLYPLQKKNEDNEKMVNIMKAAGITVTNNEDVYSLFDKYCTKMLIINNDGIIIDECSDAVKTKCKAFNINLKNELSKMADNKDYSLPVYVLQYDNKIINVIPLQGTGLWGPIWGYMALSEDFDTVIGTVFDHKSETPGLGAEITTEKFSNQFKDKRLFKNGVFKSIAVVKGGISALDTEEQKYAVDAISGGTITSNGVNDMIRNTLELYLPYIEKQNDKQ